MAIESERGRAKFIIVCNDPHLSTALGSRIESAGAAAVLAPTLQQAQLEVDALANAMLLDVALPDGSGLDFLEGAAHAGVTLHVLVISGVLSGAVANRAHRLGASCVFLPEISANVRSFVDRTIASTETVAQRKLAAARELSATFGFTRREQEIATLVAGGVPRRSLAIELGVSENTLKTLVRRMLEKCPETSLDGLARAIHEHVVALSYRAEPI
ncbi:MAG: LuxR C-terminal-related transcriptional regulator [Sandaracinaceae bacterium]|nr:LuxR C-terminal-related transcriptional regulator [Sandaracinaceae bacterium]